MHNNPFKKFILLILLLFIISLTFMIHVSKCSSLVDKQVNVKSVKFKIKTVVSSIAYPRGLFALSNGDLYILVGVEVHKYSNGRKTLSLSAGVDPEVSLDEANQKFYVSNAIDSIVTVFNLVDLSNPVDEYGYPTQCISVNTYHNYFILNRGNRLSYFLLNKFFFNPIVIDSIPNSDTGIASSPLNGDIFYVNSKQILRLVLPNTVTVLSAATRPSSGVDAQFVESEFSNPFRLFYTKHDELFITDTDLKNVKRIVNGTITTIAGSNNPTSGCIDDSDPLNCYLQYPYGVHVNSKNEIYISDRDSNSVKKIYPYCSEVGYVLSGNGRECLPKCFGISAEETSSVCNGNGICVNVDKCQCKDGYYGANCSVPTCFGKFSNNSQVCNGNGSCIAFDICECFNQNKYSGENCNIPVCYGVLANNETSVCSGRGSCLLPNTCQCKDENNYGGMNCETFKCGGILSTNSSFVCSGRGTCNSLNECQCSSNYGGLNCDLFKCNGILQNSSQVCNGKGACQDVNKCQCAAGYYGSDCSVPTCFGKFSNNSQVCNFGNGSCIAFDTCECFNQNKYTGENCNIPVCYGVLANETSVCSGRGSCLLPDTCQCKEANNYGGMNCETFKCGGILSTNSTFVCSGRGTCNSLNECQCSSNYGGLNCETFKCNGILQNSSHVCNGKGACLEVNKCQCVAGYYGSDCEFTTCFGIDQQSSQVCNFGNGTCLSFDNCKCLNEEKWFGNACNVTKCYGKSSTDYNVCNSHGKCENLDSCKCEKNYIGKQCELRYLSAMVLSFSSSVDFVGELTSNLNLNIQDSDFIQSYSNKTIHFIVEFILNGESFLNQTLEFNGVSFKLPANIPKGKLSSKVTFYFNSIQISLSFETSNSLSIEQRNTPSDSGNTVAPLTSRVLSEGVPTRNSSKLELLELLIFVMFMIMQ